MKKLLVVDGNSILNRAFYGVRPLTTRDGRNTNAIFGFINMLSRVKRVLSSCAESNCKPEMNRKNNPQRIGSQDMPTLRVIIYLLCFLRTLYTKIVKAYLNNK